MIETKQVVICDRCKKVAGELPTFPDLTIGYYRGWYRYMDPGEEDICDSCMWADSRYIAVYGRVMPSIAAAKEFRYGDDKTVHRTGLVNVELDDKGEVVSVWFRCMPLPFDQHKVRASRAEEMRRMYEKHPMRNITAVVFEERANG